ncbi:MAG: hypothetical protein LBP98_00630 [Tannerella sp.]|jgi:hypothetical protein|nr:hypothetical protein [Tannerella sp.]
MKTRLSIILFALLTLSGHGQAPAFQWGAVVRSSDQSTTLGTNIAWSIKQNAGGDMFLFGTFVSSNGTNSEQKPAAFKYIDYKHYDAQGNLTLTQSPNGALTTTAISGNNNLFLYKTDPQGKLRWQIVSNRGNVTTHYSQVVPTVDGGALLAVTTRFSGNNEIGDNRLLRIVNADGNSTAAGSIKRESFTVNNDQGVLVKINANGYAEWTKHFIRVDESQIGTNLASIALYINDLVAADDGNYWLAGRFIKPITLDKPDGSTVTLTPHNVEGWNGDSQNTRGDALLLKLDPEGRYLWHLPTGGTVDYQSINSLHLAGNALYHYGNIAATNGAPDSNASLLGTNLYPSEKINAWSARLNIGGDEPVAEWVTLLKSLPQTNGKGGRIKVTRLCYDSNALFLCGSVNGIIAVNGETVLANDAATGESSNPLMGFIIRQNPVTGAIVNAHLDPAAGLAAEIESVALRQNKLFAFGYTLGSSWLHVYNEQFEPLATHTLLTANGATAWDALFLNDRFITINRGRQMQLVSGTISGAPQAFIDDDPPAYSACFLAWQLDGLQRPTAIWQPSAVGEQPHIHAGRSTLYVEGKAALKIHSITGTLRFAGQIDGYREIPLPPGIYVVTANNRTSKILVTPNSLREN